MKLRKTDYDKNFIGFFLIDCVVRKKDKLYFVLEQEHDEETNTPPKNKILSRVITCFDDKNPENRWGYQDLKGMQRLKAGVSYQPKEQFVGVSLNDHVYVLGSGDDELEDDLKGSNSKQLKAQNAPRSAYKLRGGISRLRTIDGLLWGCGLGRTVIVREGRNQWRYLTDVIPYDYDKEKSGGGFEDMDGFSAQDMYAAGGQGDVWHYDGTKWRRLPFPSNMDLYTVCCAGDGFVYIGAESGSVFKGRGNEWKLISRGKMSLPFRDMVWHQGKVWGTSDYGLWVVEKDKVKEADVPDKVRACSGHLSVGDGVMLLAGIYGAALHDGESWQMIIDFGELD